MIRFTDFVAVARAGPTDPHSIALAATAALAALDRGRSASLVLILDAAAFAAPGALKALPQRPPFQPPAQLFDELQRRGAQLYVLGACLVEEGMDPAVHMDSLDIITTEELVDLLLEARATLQLA